ncbi:unnamed protein product [Paramecium sonneborni]|uniref:Uncharacterized protein n=1 Tax=Paramecium sonneborni TaxID=65129 RepID=A0A8S1PYU7_9CILI|nr:unnamed protein product [Paramecium sonneborni]
MNNKKEIERRIQKDLIIELIKNEFLDRSFVNQPNHLKGLQRILWQVGLEQRDELDNKQISEAQYLYLNHSYWILSNKIRKIGRIHRLLLDIQNQVTKHIRIVKNYLVYCILIKRMIREGFDKIQSFIIIFLEEETRKYGEKKRLIYWLLFQSTLRILMQIDVKKYL